MDIDQGESVVHQLDVLPASVRCRRNPADQSCPFQGVEMERQETGREAELIDEFARCPVAVGQCIDDRQPARITQRGVDLRSLLDALFDFHDRQITNGRPVIQELLNEFAWRSSDVQLRPADPDPPTPT